MSRKSASAGALARSYRAERTLTSIAGLVALLAGAAALLAGYGVLGEFRARRPVLDPIAVDWLAARPVPGKIAAIVLGLLMLIFGLWWLARSLRTEGRPDLELDRSPGQLLTVTAGAVAEAVRADAESVQGISRARVRSVGDAAAPALRLSLWLRAGTDVRQVWDELDTGVLARAREALGVESLPTAVRIELDAAARQRVK
ncbi:hypothetical protein [Amycolatopsis nigrescens]|uniref:hypothetical protein n=1 Tax=Amycolatopsis nigrescens TaxID=381445 RepID=UPI000364DED8|nr:hypothetical protein [Amycolatopsis nigrescens]